MTMAVLERLNALPGSQWMPNAPAASEDLVALEEKFNLKLPPDYCELMLTTNGFGLYGHRTQFNLESANELFWHADDPRFKEKLPDMFVFGDDNSDALFYYDPTNRLGKGEYAIFQVDFALMGFPYSKYAAETLTDLIHLILANNSIWAFPYLGPLHNPDRAE